MNSTSTLPQHASLVITCHIACLLPATVILLPCSHWPDGRRSPTCQQLSQSRTNAGSPAIIHPLVEDSKLFLMLYWLYEGFWVTKQMKTYQLRRYGKLNIAKFGITSSATDYGNFFNKHQATTMTTLYVKLRRHKPFIISVILKMHHEESVLTMHLCIYNLYF